MDRCITFLSGDFFDLIQFWATFSRQPALASYCARARVCIIANESNRQCTVFHCIRIIRSVSLLWLEFVMEIDCERDGCVSFGAWQMQSPFSLVLWNSKLHTDDIKSIYSAVIPMKSRGSRNSFIIIEKHRNSTGAANVCICTIDSITRPTRSLKSLNQLYDGKNIYVFTVYRAEWNQQFCKSTVAICERK